MAFDGRVYRILIASPSDVLEEREVAVRVMQDWNDLHSSSRQVVVLPLRWETHTAPEFGVRPQEAINRRIVDDCDLIVGIFWTKLGTPTGVADSGTLEEIERVAKAGKPVMLYFSHVPVDPNLVDSSQVERLKAFRKSILANALVESFRTSLEFRDKFSSQLELKIRDLQKEDNEGYPIPISLEFLSLPNGEPNGNSMSFEPKLPELPDGELPPEPCVNEYAEEIIQDERLRAGVVPLVLAIKNDGSSGIRNLYVELSIRTTSPLVTVLDLNPYRREHLLFNMDFFKVGEPSEVDRAIEMLSEKGLVKEGDKWKVRFEWDAIQPQRRRVILPVLYLQSTIPYDVELNAKVYADSFANPIVLTANLSVKYRSCPIDLAMLVEKAKEREKAKVKKLATENVEFMEDLSPIIVREAEKKDSDRQNATKRKKRFFASCSG